MAPDPETTPPFEMTIAWAVAPADSARRPPFRTVVALARPPEETVSSPASVNDIVAPPASTVAVSPDCNAIPLLTTPEEIT